MLLCDSPWSADPFWYCFLFLQILPQHRYILCLQKNHLAVIFISYTSPTELHFLFKKQKRKKKKREILFCLWVWWFWGGCVFGVCLGFLFFFSANTLAHGVLKHLLTSLDNSESSSLVLLSIKRWLAFPGLSFPVRHCTCFAFRVCGDKSSSQ